MATNQITVPMHVNAPVGKVWSALTDSRSQWWPGLIFEPMVGSPVIEKWVEEDEFKKALGMITAVQPNSLLIFKWGDPAQGSAREVEIRLTSEGDNTQVVVTETGLDDSSTVDVLSAEHETRWQYQLEQLRDYCQQ